MATGERFSFQNVGNFRRIPLTNMFRSGRPDRINEAEMEKFAKLNIQTIYDLRSMKEYPTASGQKLADDLFQPLLVKPSVDKPTAPHFIKIDKTGKNLPVNHFDEDLRRTALQGQKKHYIFDLVSGTYFRNVIYGLPLQYRIPIYFIFFLYKISGWGFLQKCLTWLIFKWSLKHLLEFYKSLIDFCGKDISAVLHLMSEPENVPGVVCCAHGKDRTGILSALLMGLSGADKHSIALEYNRTEEYCRERADEIMVDIDKYGLHSSFLGAEYSTMASLIDYIDKKYGSVAGYLSSIGLDEEDQKRLLRNISSVNS